MSARSAARAARSRAGASRSCPGGRARRRQERSRPSEATPDAGRPARQERGGARAGAGRRRTAPARRRRPARRRSTSPSCAPSTIACATSCSARAPAPSWSRRGSTPRSWGRRLRWKGGARLRPPPRARSASTATPIWDSGEKPLVDELIKVSERPIKPGPHTLTVKLEVRPGEEGREGARQSRLRIRADVRRPGPRRQDDHRGVHGRRRRRSPRVRAGDRARAEDGKMIALLVALLCQPAGAAPHGRGRLPSRGRPDGAVPGAISRRRACSAATRRRRRWSKLRDGAGRGGGRSGHRQRRDRQRPPLQDRRVAALRPVRVRARLRDRRADAGARAHPGGRHQERRALPAARARPRRQGAAVRPRLPRAGRHRARDARRRRRCWRCSITTIRRAARRCRATARAEHAYLAGKVAYEAGETAHAEALFSGVDRQSRFYAAALYFRGLIQARQNHFASARRNLCEIVEQADQDRFTFFIDGRYFAVKDLAYLALGRIAHEQGKYDDAYYFYFRVPDRLGAAARRALRGVVVDVPEGGVRGGARLPRGVRPHLPGVAAGARRDAAARDDRPQVVPVRQRAGDAGQVREGLRADRGAGGGAAQGSRQARRALPAPAQQGVDRARRTIRSSSCSRSTRASTSSTATSRRSIARPASSPTRSPSGTS